ncbi:hypothetical protein AM500_18765 [Bacillus sp. FJAT-18017]|uniref:Fur-regulated basic protein FbpA n=1 Tax=Bacillus sp. FJAT-18017 TaxID=1705566 RepID=UPI0006AF123D|nr:Fur-regulated basic protein FbpA [Bacillus sp. FJAT-18017]ALC91598.1 hypothetical protein AM500_18765 [Bacillus sp. FJAT-18017]
MGKLKDIVEQKRSELISKLIGLDNYRKNKKHLYELTLSELEYEYFKTQYSEHPHAGFGSIRWKN